MTDKYTLRTGFGYDSHRFLTKKELEKAKSGAVDTGEDFIDPDKPLVLGGVVMKGLTPFKARSDGDVVFHAAVNAILSALSIPEARDIGMLFPNTDKQNTNRNSSDFLKESARLVTENNYEIIDLKLTLKSKLKVDLDKIRENIAEILNTENSTVLIQGTSGEDMDAAGRGEGVEVFGICTINRLMTIDHRP